MFLIRLLIVIFSTALLFSCGGGGGGGGSEKSADVSFKIDMSSILSDGRSPAHDMTVLEISQMVLSYGSGGQMSSMDVTEAVRNDSPITISDLYINRTYTFEIEANSGSRIVCSGSTDVLLRPNIEVTLACTTNGAAYSQFNDIFEIVDGVELSDGRTLFLDNTGLLRTYNKYMSFTEDDDVQMTAGDDFYAMVKSEDDDTYIFGQDTNDGYIKMFKYDSDMVMTAARTYDYSGAVPSDAAVLPDGNIAVRLHGGNYGVLKLNPSGDVVGFISVEHMSGETDQKLLHSSVSSKFVILDGTSYTVLGDSLGTVPSKYSISDGSNDLMIHDGIIRESDGALLLVGEAGSAYYLVEIPAPYTSSGNAYQINETLSADVTKCVMAYNGTTEKYLLSCLLDSDDTQHIFLNNSLAVESYKNYYFNAANLPDVLFAGFGGRFIEAGTIPMMRYIKRIGSDGTMGVYDEDYPPQSNPVMTISAPVSVIVTPIF